MTQPKRYRIKKHLGDEIEEYCNSGLAMLPYEWAKYFEHTLREGKKSYYDKVTDKKINKYPRTMNEIVKNVNYAYINIDNESQRLLSHLFSPCKTWIVAEPEE